MDTLSVRLKNDILEYLESGCLYRKQWPKIFDAVGYEAYEQKRENYARRQFIAADSTGEYRDLMLRYLRGELYANPWVGGPIASETAPLLASLCELHNLGYMTIESQPQMAESGESKHWKPRYWQIKQRAYVIGMVHSSIAKRLWTRLSERGLYCIVEYSNGAMLRPRDEHSSPYTVTKQRASDSSNMTNLQKWEAVTRLGCELNNRGMQGRDHELASDCASPRVAKYIMRSLAVVTVGDPNWRGTNLLQVITAEIKKLPSHPTFPRR